MGIVFLHKKSMDKIFVDINVVIDFIEQRSFDKDEVIDLFTMAEKEAIDILISESVITTALYVTKNPAQLQRVLKLVNVICINGASIKLAIDSSFADK